MKPSSSKSHSANDTFYQRFDQYVKRVTEIHAVPISAQNRMNKVVKQSRELSEPLCE